MRSIGYRSFVASSWHSHTAAVVIPKVGFCCGSTSIVDSGATPGVSWPLQVQQEAFIWAMCPGHEISGTRTPIQPFTDLVVLMGFLKEWCKSKSRSRCRDEASTTVAPTISGWPLLPHTASHQGIGTSGKLSKSRLWQRDIQPFILTLTSLFTLTTRSSNFSSNSSH